MKSSNPHILCIDPDDRTPLWIRDQLNRSQIRCDITAVSSGREGFRKLNSGDFDLCVVEYALPDMTGVQLCALVRQMGSSVPMLFFTPMNRNVDRQRAETAGASAYLTKPDDFDLFVDTATHLLKRNTRIYAVPAKHRDLARAA